MKTFVTAVVVIAVMGLVANPVWAYLISITSGPATGGMEIVGAEGDFQANASGTGQLDAGANSETDSAQSKFLVIPEPITLLVLLGGVVFATTITRRPRHRAKAGE